MATAAPGGPIVTNSPGLPASLRVEAPPSRTPPLRRTESTKDVYVNMLPSPPLADALGLQPAFLLGSAEPSPQTELQHCSSSFWSPLPPPPVLLSRSASAPTMKTQRRQRSPEPDEAILRQAPPIVASAQAPPVRGPDFIFDFSQGSEHRFTPKTLQGAVRRRLCKLLNCHRAPEGEMFALIKTSWFTYLGEMDNCYFHGDGEFKIFGRRPWRGQPEWCGEFGLHSLPISYGGYVVSHKGSWRSGRTYEGETRYSHGVIRKATYEAGNPRLRYTLTTDASMKHPWRALQPGVTIEGTCHGREIVIDAWETPEGRFEHAGYSRGVMEYKDGTKAPGKMEPGGVFVKDTPVRKFWNAWLPAWR